MKVKDFMFYIGFVVFIASFFKITANVISLGEVADFGKIKLKLKNKYDAKRKRE